jgi:hypothetical protein
LLVFLEARAEKRVEAVEAVCSAVQVGDRIEQIAERAAERELAVLSRSGQYLLWSRPGVRLTAALAFCDVRLKDGRVASKKFFRD